MTTVGSEPHPSGPRDAPPGDDTLRFEQLVFSGGGTRCFWQGGFLGVVAPAIGLKPARIIGVSGGALSAAGMIAGRAQEMKQVMLGIVDRVERNVDWHAIENGGSLTPHQRVYREIVAEVLGDDEAQQRVADGPAFHVQLGIPPSARFPRASTIPLFSLYEAEKAARSTPHLRWPKRAGMRVEMVDARQAARDGRLVELICAAAVIPPVFKIAVWDGRQVIDSGMAEQAPMPPDGSGPTLVLLTSGYRNLPRVPGRIYAQPSHETPADKIDFTDPDKLRRTWELGRADGRRFLDLHGVTADDHREGDGHGESGTGDGGHARHRRGDLESP